MEVDASCLELVKLDYAKVKEKYKKICLIRKLILIIDGVKIYEVMLHYCRKIFIDNGIKWK